MLMKALAFGGAVLSVASVIACEGTTQVASSDPSAQTQAQLNSSATANADGEKHPGGPHQGHPHGPPPAAFEACNGKAVGDVCSLTFRDETLAGKCVSPPSGAPDTRIACRPDKMPEPPQGHGPRGGHPHGPPPAQVFTACDGKTADQACSFTIDDKTIDGVCRTPPPGVSETRLGCAPSAPPPR